AFFFQAEDGIRDPLVTGVQTCALPISRFGSLYAHQERAFRALSCGRNVVVTTGTGSGKTEAFLLPIIADVLKAKASGVAGTKARSEERRVGKERRVAGWEGSEKKE